VHDDGGLVLVAGGLVAQLAERAVAPASDLAVAEPGAAELGAGADLLDVRERLGGRGRSPVGLPVGRRVIRELGELTFSGDEPDLAVPIVRAAEGDVAVVGGPGRLGVVVAVGDRR